MARQETKFFMANRCPQLRLERLNPVRRQSSLYRKATQRQGLMANTTALPLVSICIPAYNAAPFIAATLESALRQDYPHREIIVSDDGSTDETPEIIRSFTHRGVMLLRQECNRGVNFNFNTVIRASRGKYVCKLDSDDLLTPAYLSSLVPVMENHPRVTFAHCACRLIDAQGNLLGYERSIQGSFLRSGLDEWPRYVFGARAVNIVLIRRSAFDQVGGYDEDSGLCGDWKMHRDLLKIGDVFYHDGVLASYRVHAIGKADKRFLEIQSYVKQLEDMDQNWPAGVPHKTRLLTRARRYLATQVVMAAAQAEPTEAQKILRYVPQYGNCVRARMLALVVQNGGADLIRSYLRLKLSLRQMVKRFFYKSPDRGTRAAYAAPGETEPVN
jgi:glycosyltransferase involved in cell wall biosynthesis